MTVKQSIAAITAAAAIGGGVYEGTVSDGPVNVVREGELVSQRTETAVVYDAGNGKRRAEVHTKPVHWYDASDRDWKTIDTAVKAKPILRQLVSSRDYETTAGPYTADYETDKPYNYRLVAGGASVAYIARFDTTKAVTVTVEPTTTGVKETVILADETAPTRLDWTVETDVVFTARGDGGYVADGLTIEPPVAWDAKGATVPVTVSMLDGVYSLTVDTKGAAFPVTVDPTTSVAAVITGQSGKVSNFAATSTYTDVRDATTGSDATPTDPYYIGQQYLSGPDRYGVFRSFLSFAMPPLVSVAACTLYVDGNDDLSTTDFNVNVYGARSYRSTITTADFSKFNGWAASGAYGGTALTNTWSTASYSANWNKLIFAAAGLDSIVAAKGDTLWLALLSSRDVASTQPTGDERISFSKSTNAPYLSLTYTLPSVNIHDFKMTPISATSIKVEWQGNTGADSLALKVYGTNAIKEYLNKAALADTITGLNPYTKYRYYIDADSGAVATSTNADSCWTTSEPTTVTVAQPSARYHEVHSPVFNVARAMTSPDSIAGDVLSTAGWLGTYIDTDKYVWRNSLNDYFPQYTRIISGSIKATGVEDGSTTDFTVNVFAGSWSAGDQIDERHHEFSGWAAGTATYGGTSLISTWTTASYGAAITWPFTRGGLDQLLTARGDTLRLAILSSRDVAATAPGGSEYIRVQAPYLSLTVDLPDSVPTGFTLSAISADSILAVWEERAHSERGYVLMDLDTGAKVAGTDTLAANTESARIGGLKHNTLYRWYVKAVGGGAHGMDSGADSTYTKAKAPAAAPTLTFPSGTAAKVVIDTTGMGNPEWTEYAIQDSLSGKYVDWISGAPDTLAAAAEWRTYANWGGAAGDTVTVAVGKKYGFRVKARSGQ